MEEREVVGWNCGGEVGREILEAPLESDGRLAQELNDFTPFCLSEGDSPAGISASAVFVGGPLALGCEAGGDDVGIPDRRPS